MCSVQISIGSVLVGVCTNSEVCISRYRGLGQNLNKVCTQFKIYKKLGSVMARTLLEVGPNMLWPFSLIEYNATIVSTCSRLTVAVYPGFTFYGDKLFWQRIASLGRHWQFLLVVLIFLKWNTRRRSWTYQQGSKALYKMLRFRARVVPVAILHSVRRWNPVSKNDLWLCIIDGYYRSSTATTVVLLVLRRR